MFVICTFDDHRGKNDDSDGSEHNNYGSEPEHNIMLGILVKPWLTVVRLRLRRISQHSESECYFLRFNAIVGHTIYMMEVSVLEFIVMVKGAERVMLNNDHICFFRKNMS